MFSHWTSIQTLPKDLLLIKEILYDKLNFKCTQPIVNPEGKEYSACDFKINAIAIKFRISKITPTKTGQFVTLWKRIGNGTILPFDAKDPIGFFIISSRKENNFGHFIFPKSVLIAQGILTSDLEGKRAIRVYPPWDLCTNKQAQKTQKWQLNYFFEMKNDAVLDFERANLLYSAN